MSAIDVYQHRLLGYIECPSTNNLVYNNDTRKIAIYQLLQDIPNDEVSFDGKAGDILVGGGRGEAPSLRISNPLAFRFFTLGDADFYNLNFNHLHDIFLAFWSPTQSYVLCEGFLKLGWTIDREVDMWLAENVCKLLIQSSEQFSVYKTFDMDLSTNLMLMEIP